jgi:hypothetical protein
MPDVFTLLHLFNRANMFDKGVNILKTVETQAIYARIVKLDFLTLRKIIKINECLVVLFKRPICVSDTSTGFRALRSWRLFFTGLLIDILKHAHW